jgi:hypothetical protein
MRLLRVGLLALETRFLWVFSVRLFVYQDGETWFRKSPRNPVFPSLSMMMINVTMKTGFLSKMKSRVQPDFTFLTILSPAPFFGFLDC